MLGTEAGDYEPGKLFGPNLSSGLSSGLSTALPAQYGYMAAAYASPYGSTYAPAASPAQPFSYALPSRKAAPSPSPWPTSSPYYPGPYSATPYAHPSLDAYAAYNASNAYASAYASAYPSAPASYGSGTYQLAHLPPSTSISSTPSSIVSSTTALSAAAALPPVLPDSTAPPPSKKPKAKKKKPAQPTPSPEGEFVRVVVWDMDEVVVPLAQLIHGTYAAKYGKERGRLSQLGTEAESLVMAVAEASFHFGEVEVRECDQVQIEDTAVEEGPGSAGDGWGLVGEAAVFPPTPGLRGGVDWMRKLSYRYKLIRDLYERYKTSPTELLGGRSEEWTRTRAELDSLTAKWTEVVGGLAAEVGRREGYANVLLTSHHLVPAIVKALLFGLAPSVPIDNIYSTAKAGRNAILERIMGRFGKKASYVIVGASKEGLPPDIAPLHFHVNCHDHLLSFAHLIRSNYL